MTGSSLLQGLENFNLSIWQLKNFWWLRVVWYQSIVSLQSFHAWPSLLATFLTKFDSVFFYMESFEVLHITLVVTDRVCEQLKVSMLNVWTLWAFLQPSGWTARGQRWRIPWGGTTRSEALSCRLAEKRSALEELLLHPECICDTQPSINRSHAYFPFFLIYNLLRLVHRKHGWRKSLRKIIKK